MRTVFNELHTPGGPLKDALVEIFLVASDSNNGGEGFVPVDSAGIIGQWNVRTDDTGRWEAELEANADIEPDGTYYRIVEYYKDQPVEHLIIVPALEGESWLFDLVVEAPASPANLPLAVHEQTIGNHDDVDLAGAPVGAGLGKVDADTWGAVSFATAAALEAEEAARVAADEALQLGVDARIPLAEKGAAEGVATLGPDGKLENAQVPAMALSEFLGTVANEAAMLALVGQRGDWTIRTDFAVDRVFILETDDPTLAANWTDISGPGDVFSVNGQTGAVLLDAVDVGAPAIAALEAETDARTAADTALQADVDSKETPTGAQEKITFHERKTVTQVRFEPDQAVADRAAAPLIIPTYDGGGQAVHPDVVYVPEGWNSYRYWMAMTPYPNDNAALENPSIVASHDGQTWEVPPGQVNPIDVQPVGGINSDTDLVLGPDDTMYCFYRQDFGAGPYNVYVQQSVDGVTWGNKQLVLAGDATDNLLSPAVLWMGDRWLMFVVNSKDAAPRTLERWEASDLAGPWVETVSTIAPIPAGRGLWHIDVVRAGDELHAFVLVGALGGSSVGTRIHFAVSQDDGETWLMSTNHVLEGPGGPAWSADRIYRATGVLLEKGPSLRYGLWYSARSAAAVWGIGYTEIRFLTEAEDIDTDNLAAFFSDVDHVHEGAGHTHEDFVSTADFKVIRRTVDGPDIVANIVLANDAQMKFAVLAGERWEFDLLLVVSGSNPNHDAKFGWSVPAGASMIWGVGGGLSNEVPSVGGRSTTPMSRATEASSVTVATLAGISLVSLRGVVIAGANDGDVNLQVAQAVSDPGVLKILENSFLKLTRLP